MGTATFVDAHTSEGSDLNDLGEIVGGLRVSEDNEAFVLRRANSPDLRVPRSEVRRASFTKMSMMPEGLLDALQPGDVSDLFAYLKTLK